jgi:hypothetical protein
MASRLCLIMFVDISYFLFAKPKTYKLFTTKVPLKVNVSAFGNVANFATYHCLTKLCTVSANVNCVNFVKKTIRITIGMSIIYHFFTNYLPVVFKCFYSGHRISQYQHTGAGVPCLNIMFHQLFLTHKSSFCGLGFRF